MIEHSRQALVGAIGGAYISLAIADIDELTISNFALLSSGDFTRPMDAVERYLKSLPRCPNKVGFAVAGDVVGDRADLGQRNWSITKNDVRATTGADHINLINDYEALALALPHLTSYDLVTLFEGEPALHATKLVIYAGTALGSAAVIHDGTRWVPMRGEAGRMEFPVPLSSEFDIEAAFESGAFISTSDVFSGPGLVALYRALGRSRSIQHGDAGARRIVETGLNREDPNAVEALDLMAVWLGRYAGDMALAFGARGGVYLAGGLAANIVPVLSGQRFRDAFQDKGPAASYLGKVAVNVIKTGADAGLRGAAIALAEHLPARPTTVRRLAT